MKPKNERTFFIFFFIFIWTYLIFRAIYVPFQHDEAATFFHYIVPGEFIPFYALWDANNHLLNSFLTWVSYNVFGNSRLALRLPNLLIAPLYFYFFWKISGRLKDRFFRSILLLTLFTSAGLIEFFALCRGYGMSMAFLAGAIYFVIRFFEDVKTKYVLLSILLIHLSISSNLTLLISGFILVGLMAFKIVIDKAENSKLFSLNLSLIFITGIMPLISFALLGIKMKKLGLLYYGSQLGFWPVTIKSLLILFRIDYSLSKYLLAFIFIMIAIGFLLAIRNSFSFKGLLNKNFIFFYLLCGNVVSIILMNKILNVNFPEDRTALFLFPFLVGAFFFISDFISGKIHSKISLTFSVLWLYFPLHFFINMNFSYSQHWNQDSIPSRFFNKIQALSEGTSYPPTIGGYIMRHFCWSYLNFINGGKMSQVQGSNFPSLVEDYQIVKVDQKANWMKYYQSLDYDPSSEFHLLKRKDPPAFQLWNEITNLENNSSNEFFDFYKDSILPGNCSAMKFEFDLNVSSPVIPFEGFVVVDISDKEHNNLKYNFISLKWLRKQWGGGNVKFINSMVVSGIPENRYFIKLYFWNKNRVEYQLHTNKISIFELTNL